MGTSPSLRRWYPGRTFFFSFIHHSLSSPFSISFPLLVSPLFFHLLTPPTSILSSISSLFPPPFSPFLLPLIHPFHPLTLLSPPPSLRNSLPWELHLATVILSDTSAIRSSPPLPVTLTDTHTSGPPRTYTLSTDKDSSVSTDISKSYRKKKPMLIHPVRYVRFPVHSPDSANSLPYTQTHTYIHIHSDLIGIYTVSSIHSSLY